MKQFLVSIIAVLIFTQSAWAGDKAYIEKLVTTKINAVVDLIKDGSLEKQQRNDEIIKLVKPIFNFRLMGRLSIGGENWKKMDKTQKKQFIANFTERLQESFLEKLDLYTDERVEYGAATPTKKKRIQMAVNLITKDDKIELMFKFHKKKKSWKLYDLEIIGVSVVQTYRSQFKNELKKGGIDSLIHKLRQTGGFKLDTKS